MKTEGNIYDVSFPKLGQMPVFYRDVMYREAEPGEDTAYLKLFDGREWKWFQVKLLHTDMEYLRKKWSGKKGIRTNFGKETS